MIEFKCRHCGKFLKLPQSYAGRTTECPACRRVVQVPGTAPAGTTAGALRSTAPKMGLCVDCGRTFPARQLMEHTGQLVCFDCYHSRRPVQLKPIRRRKKGRRRRLILLAVLLAAVAVAAWLLVRYAL